MQLDRNLSLWVMGALKLKVADLDIVDLSLSKDSQDGADCWFDLDASLYSETLNITSITGRTIPEGGITYTLIGTRVPFLVTKITGCKDCRNKRKGAIESEIVPY